MKLLTDLHRHRLLANGVANGARIADGEDTEDFYPVVKLFCPWGAATWLLTELDPQDPDLAFGLCDLGFGTPEIGSVRLSEIEGVRGPGGLTIERDIHFTADKTLSAYAGDARQHGAIRA